MKHPHVADVILEAKKLLGSYPLHPLPALQAGRKLGTPLINPQGSFDCPDCRSSVGWSVEELIPPVLPGRDACGICRRCGCEFLITYDAVEQAVAVGQRHDLPAPETQPGDDLDDDDEQENYL